MRKAFLALAIGLCSLILQGVWMQAEGEGAIPLFTYTGDVLPSQDGWTIVNYPSYESTGAHVESGVLHFTDHSTEGGSAIHYERQWNVDPGGLDIAEFDIRGKTCGGVEPTFGYACIYFGTSDGNHNMIYTVYPDRIESAFMDNGFYGLPDTIGDSYAFDTTQTFNTYKAVIVDGRARLYVNDLLVMDQPAGRGVYGVNGVEFGAGSSPAFGEAYFDEIRAYRISRSEWEACVNPPPGMIGWWPGDGNAHDIIGGHNGTLENGADFTAGVVSDAFRFDDAQRQHVRIPHSPDLDIRDGLTIDLWVMKRGSCEDLNCWLVAKGNKDYSFDTQNGRYGIFITDASYWPPHLDNRVGLSFNTGTWEDVVVGTTLIQNDIWYHVAGTWDGAVAKVYVNGVLENSVPKTGTILPTTEQGSLTIGAEIFGDSYLPYGEHFEGLIDEVEIFNRALSADEIRAIYLAGAAGKCRPAPVDIRPGGCPNPLSTKELGVLPVAIAGTATLDVTQIDPASVRLEGVAPLRSSLMDVATPYEPYTGKVNALDCMMLGPDGFMDLVLQLDAPAIIATLGTVVDGQVRVLKLTGNLLPAFGGRPIVGEDVVVIQVPPGRPPR